MLKKIDTQTNLSMGMNLFSYYQFPLFLSQVMTTEDLGEWSRVNHAAHRAAAAELHARRLIQADRLLYYFYYCTPPAHLAWEKRIALHLRYDSIYRDNVRLLFRLLPELFAFIAKEGILSLDMSAANSWYGPAEVARGWVYDTEEEKQIILRALSAGLMANETLEYCNLGLFAKEISYAAFYHIFEHHPVIDCATLHTSGAQTNWNYHPSTLWRKRDDGSLYWANLRQEDKDE